MKILQAAGGAQRRAQAPAFAPAADHVVWIRSDSIGDSVLAAAMLAPLRTAMPQATLTVVCQEPIAPLYEPCPFIDQIVAFDGRRITGDARYREGVVAALRGLGARLCLNSVYSRSPVTDLLAVATGAPEKLAFEGGLDNMSADVRARSNRFYTRLVPNGEGPRTELERHRQFLAALGIDSGPLHPVVWTQAEDEAAAEGFFREHDLDPARTIALYAGVQSEVRAYEAYGRALAALCREQDLAVIALGAGSDAGVNQRCLDESGARRRWNLSGQTTLRQSVALLRRCRLSVGAETGLGHIACAVGRPCVVLLGGGHFGRFMPYAPSSTMVALPLDCFGCNWKCRHARVHCVRDVDPRVIEAAVRATLDSTSTRPRVFVASAGGAPGAGCAPRWPQELLPAARVEIVEVALPAAPEAAAGATPKAPGEAPPQVSIVIPVWNRWDFTARCLAALAKACAGVSHEIIVVDNGSTDETARALAARPDVRCLRNERNLGFGRACNQGAAVARGRALVFLNNDAQPLPGWLAALVAAERAHAGADADAAGGEEGPGPILGSLLLFPDGTVQHAGFALCYGAPFPVTVLPLHYGKPATAVADGRGPRPVSAVSGASLYLLRPLFQALGGFDEGFESGYEDVDLCLRAAERGVRTWLCPDSQAAHHEAASGGRFAHEARNLDLFQSRWLPRLPRFDLDYRAKLDGRPRPPGDQRAPVSVLVLAHNAVPSVVPCLEALRASLAPGDQIVLVDDDARPATAVVLRDFAARHPVLCTLVTNDRPAGSAPRALARGLSHARHDCVAVLGPHLQVPPGWLERMVPALLARPALRFLYPRLDRSAPARLLPDAPPPAPEEAPPMALEALTHPAVDCVLARKADLLAHLSSSAAAAEALLPAFDDGVAATAPEVVVCSFTLMAAGAGPGPEARTAELSARYLAAQAARGHPGAGASPPPLTSIVILVWNNLALTRACVDSVFRHTRVPFEIVLVDNGSREDVVAYTAALQAQHPGVVVVLRNQENQGYAYGCNQGLQAARGAYAVLLNNDVVVTAGWLDRLLAAFAADPGLGLLGPTTNAAFGQQLVGRSSYPGPAALDRFAADWAREHRGELKPVHRLVGLCLVMPRAVLETVGGFDTLFGYGNFEDDDLGLRVQRAGYRLAVACDVFVHHAGSATFSALSLDSHELCRENWELFRHKWSIAEETVSESGWQRLAAAAPFDRQRDHIPLAAAEIFAPRGPALTLCPGKPLRLLCVPDEAAGVAELRTLVRTYLDAFGPADPVALVIRLEPPTEARLRATVAAVLALLEERALPPAAAPEITFDATPLAPRDRGALYRAVTVYLTAAGRRELVYTREARACGLPVLERPTVPALRALAASAAAPPAVALDLPPAAPAPAARGALPIS